MHALTLKDRQWNELLHNSTFIDKLTVETFSDTIHCNYKQT